MRTMDIHHAVDLVRQANRGIAWHQGTYGSQVIGPDGERGTAGCLAGHICHYFDPDAYLAGVQDAGNWIDPEGNHGGYGKVRMPHPEHPRGGLKITAPWYAQLRLGLGRFAQDQLCHSLFSAYNTLDDLERYALTLSHLQNLSDE